MRRDLQRQHENYWGKCWAIALGQHLHAAIRWSRPDEDAPDAYFHVRRHDRAEVTTWGDVTGAYYNGQEEGKWLWDGEDREHGGIYWEPDAVVGIKARERVERKRKKYRELARRVGPGHLLVLLHSPLTTRSTKVEAEGCIRELLESTPSLDSDPFETVWLGYRLPCTTPDEQEDPQHVFQDRTGAERFNFIKCIWIRGRTRETDSPRRDTATNAAPPSAVR